MKKRLLSEVLWEAANKWLTHDFQLVLCMYSCNAALAAEFGKVPMRTNRDGDTRVYRGGSKTQKFLSELGCKLGGDDGQFIEFSEGERRQGVRYMWLLLAMHVAEDEGIEI